MTTAAHAAFEYFLVVSVREEIHNIGRPSTNSIIVGDTGSIQKCRTFIGEESRVRMHVAKSMQGGTQTLNHLQQVRATGPFPVRIAVTDASRRHVCQNN